MLADSFLLELVFVLGSGLFCTLLFQRIGQPPVLGYLCAGILLSLFFKHSGIPVFSESLKVLAALGIVFMMFFLGLEFSLSRLRSIGPFTLLAGVLEIALTFWLGFVIARALNWPIPAALLCGACLCMSSTTIVVKSLVDLGKLKQPFAELSIGILLVEDLAVVMLLALLSGWSVNTQADLALTLAALGRVLAFCAATIAAGLLVIPRFFRFLDQRVGNSEILSLSAVAVCLALAGVASTLGFSVALGAFLAGALVGESGLADKIEERLSAMRDIFLAVFFVTVGLQADLSLFWEDAKTPLILLATLYLGKGLLASFSCHLTGAPLAVGFQVGFSLSQIGEFSYVLAALGAAKGLAAESFPTHIILVSLLSTLTTPYFIQAGEPLARRIERFLPDYFARALSVYQSWLKALRWPLKGFTVPRLLLPLVFRMGTLLLLLGVAVWSNVEAQYFLDRAGIQKIFFQGDVRILREIFFGMVYGLLFLLAVKTLRRLVRHFLKLRGESMDAKGKMLLGTLTFVLAAILGALFLVFAAPLVSSTTIIVVVGGVLLVYAGFLQKSFSTVDSRLDALVREIVASYGPLGLSTQAPKEIQRLLQEHYPWQAQTSDFLLPHRFCAANHPLGELQLREKTGATVLAVYRGEAIFSNPSASFFLMPGDLLVLLGEKEHLAQAAAYLRELSKHPPTQNTSPAAQGFHLDTVILPEGSPLAGRSLKELGIRSQTGASVVGLERAGSRYTPPPAQLPLQTGDVLLLLGKPEEVENAKTLLEDSKKASALLKTPAETPADMGENIADAKASP